MKKSFPLDVSGHKPARVIESIKHDVRKYLKRERRKTLPDGVDFWDFDCRIGEDKASAETVHVAEINEMIDKIYLAESSAIFVEIIAKPGHRIRKEAGKKLSQKTPKSNFYTSKQRLT